MKPLLVCAFVLSFAAGGFAVESEQEITRTIENQQQIQLELGRDVYRSVPYEDTYEVDVPYTEKEAYTDYEDYYENEYLCHTERDTERRCAMERECRDVPYDREVCEDERMCEPGREERECRQERVCEPGDVEERCENQRVCRPAGPPVCESVEECHTNDRGERQCKTRERCRPQQEECHDERVCRPHRGEPSCRFEERCETRRGEPVCHSERRCRTVRDSREECHQEHRCRDIPVDKEVCGYEQVKKTRPVTRYRDVTRYRKETRCCVTKYRDEFDHTWSIDVALKFPPEAQLVGDEKERLQVAVDSNEANPKVDLSVIESIFGYKIANQNQSGRHLDVELMRVARYSENQLGKTSIKDIAIQRLSDNTLLEFSDTGLKPRVTSQYVFQVINKETQEVVKTGALTPAAKKAQKFNLGVVLDSNLDYLVKVLVKRTGNLVLEKTIEFVVEKEAPFTRWNRDEFAEKSIKDFKVDAQKDQVLMIFKDLGHRVEIESRYRISAKVGDEVIYDQEIKAQDFLDDENRGKVSIPVSSEQQKRELEVVLKVERNSRMLPEPIAFEQSAKVTFKVDQAAFKNESLINNMFMINDGASVIFGFRDQTDAKIDSVKTYYEIKLWIKKGIFQKERVVLEDGFSRQNLTLSPKGNYLFKMGNTFMNEVDPGKKVYFEIRITREHPAWDKRIEIVKTGTVRRPGE